jgi:predicted ester cyclase
MSSEANKTVIRRYYDEVWHAGNLDALDEIMAPGLLHQQGDPSGESQKAFIAATRAKFPDLRFTLSHLVAEGDLVAWRWVFKGTNAETGLREAQDGMTMHRIRDGKVVERWIYSRLTTTEEA